MRKGTMLSVVAGLSLAILAGCSGGTNSKQASSSNDIKVWVQFSDETNEGKSLKLHQLNNRREIPCA